MSAMLVIVGIVISAGANLFHIVGTATTGWMTDDKYKFGLFQICNDVQDICGTIGSHYVTSGLMAVRALCIIGVMLGLGSLVVAILYRLVASLKSNTIIPVIILASGCAACGAIILAVVIYAADCYNSALDLGYSFALCILGALGIALGAILNFVFGRASPQ